MISKHDILRATIMYVKSQNGQGMCEYPTFKLNTHNLSMVLRGSNPQKRTIVLGFSIYKVYTITQSVKIV